MRIPRGRQANRSRRTSGGTTKLMMSSFCVVLERIQRSISGLALSPIAFTNSTYLGSCAFQINWVRCLISNLDQRGDDWIHASHICACVPPGITGHVYWKSPNKTTAFPPKGWSLFIMCLHTSSIQANVAQFNMHASSGVMRPVQFINLPREVAFWIVEDSSWLLSFTGMCLHKWADMLWWKQYGACTHLKCGMCRSPSTVQLSSICRSSGWKCDGIDWTEFVTHGIDQKSFPNTCFSIDE